MHKVALYTTVYPGVEKYLSDWYRSILHQTDSGFDICIGVDALTPQSVINAIGADPHAMWIIAGKDDSPASVRQNAIQEIVRNYSTVIFVDSDDLLEPTRVESSKKAMERFDVSACAMRIIDEKGNYTGLDLKMPSGEDFGELLIQANIFGLSNTTYNSELLGSCMPIPSICTLMDWFMITRAWSLGAVLDFDPVCRMAYRQHPQNIARVVPPFTPKEVMFSTELVLNHYKLVLSYITQLSSSQRDKLDLAFSRATDFNSAIRSHPSILHKYVEALNNLPTKHIWWTIVAHPQLEHIWKT